MAWVVLLLATIVAAGAVSVRWTRWHPVAVAAAIGAVAAVAIVVAMRLSVPAGGEAMLITGAGTFAAVAALALVGALLGLAWRRRRVRASAGGMA